MNDITMSSLRGSCQSNIDLEGAQSAVYFSLDKLENLGLGRISRLPITIRIILESLVRNCDGHKVSEDHVRDLAAWQPTASRTTEIPFIVGRIVLNCTAGIPLLGDLSAMRDALKERGQNPADIEPRVRVDMTLDHTLTVDYVGTPDALQNNMQLEIERNYERFGFVKWATHAFRHIRLIPPGYGILHQINLEFFAPGLLLKDGLAFPDTLVGTDSHTGMIAGLGTVGWGVGGIEADAAILGQPVYMLTPDVIGVNVVGKLQPGVTSTDMVLYVTEMLRKNKVVGKFVEFFGEGCTKLTVPDRATISNMAPEYGATIGFFPVDEQTCQYFRQTGRSESEVRAVEIYHRAQNCFGSPKLGDIDYTEIISLDLSQITASVAGPKRPQDRIELVELKKIFSDLLEKPIENGGYGKSAMSSVGLVTPTNGTLRDGDLAIAAITSCTNTSNPSVMLAAGLLAKKAIELGLRTPPGVKTSLAPGSRVVSEYLNNTGLQIYLDQLGFSIVGYSCTTCVGSSGPIPVQLEKDIEENDIIACAVLSGNRNFEARIHPLIRAAFLASPPLVVAFALAGRMNIDFAAEPLGTSPLGEAVYLKDVWPSADDLDRALKEAVKPEYYKKVYHGDIGATHPLWNEIPQKTGLLYHWDESSSYIKQPPFLKDPNLLKSSLANYIGARALAILGNSITTDHISPIGNIKSSSPAGIYLESLGIKPGNFNNYGSRRMNHEVMVRGTFANIQIRNRMIPGTVGGFTKLQPTGESMPIYDAAMSYAKAATPLFIFAGEEYGMGSARDWAAKGTRLLGVRVVIAKSFERIHRSNLAGMGVLPCQFENDDSCETLGLIGDEVFDLIGIDETVHSRMTVNLVVHRRNGDTETLPLILRLDTRAEISYAQAGGILPYVLNDITR